MAISKAVFIIFYFHALYTISFSTSLYSERAIFPRNFPATKSSKENKICPRLS